LASYANLEIDAFAMIMLLILFLNMHKVSGDYMPDQKLFQLMIVSTVLILAVDSIQWVLDGTPGLLVNQIVRLSSSAYYLLQPFPCLIWCLYVRYEVKMDTKAMMKPKILLLTPFFINAAMAVASYFNGYYFFVDAQNMYQRGDLFWCSVVLVYMYFFYSLLYIVLNKKNIDEKMYYSLLAFSLPPMLGSIIQIIYYGVSLIWPGVALSLLIIYLNIQKNQLYTDHLTGVYNRRLLDIHLQECLMNGDNTAQIGVLMLDIDQFKNINDSYGHIVGDQALMEAANILKRSADKKGFIARYGGDEFVIILPARKRGEVEALAAEIDRNVKSFNQKEERPYKIKFSMGFETFDCGAQLTKQEVLKSIDDQMYERKLQYSSAEKHPL